jgi:histidinol-phosphate phosphatase family protein
VSGGWSASAQRGPLTFAPNARGHPARIARAAFLDRDGVLNGGAPDPGSGLLESPLTVAEVRLLPGVPAALRALAEAGYALVCVSNQPAAAKGKVSVEQLLEVHERVLALLEAEGVTLDASFLCPHHPHGISRELAGPCDCRKPAPGMLLDAARRLELDLDGSWLFGDTDADIDAAQAARCRSVLIEYAGSAHKRDGRAHPDLRAASLGGGVAQLLDHRGG